MQLNSNNKRSKINLSINNRYFTPPSRNERMSFKLNRSTITSLCRNLLLVSSVCFVETVVAFQLPLTQTHKSLSTPSSHYHLKTRHVFSKISSITTQSRNHNHANHYNVYSLKSMSNNDNNDISELNNTEISRYSRHLVLGDVGMKGQKDLKISSVLVIGAGGLGSPCLLYLAAAGVGHIGIVDADVVDESNLQRQIIHGTSTINVSKCQSALQRIKDINPFVQVRTYEEEFTSSTAMRILGEGFSSGKKWDVVVDGSDNFPTKYLINDVCDIVGIPWVYSAILAFEGQLSVFNYKNGPTYRDMMPTPPPSGDVPSCAEGGVLGVLPGTMGCLQATEVLKILLGKDKGVLRGRILVYDALDMKFTEAGLEKLEGREEITELIDYQGFCAGPKVTPIPKTQGRTMDESEDNASDVNDADFHNIQPTEALEKLKGGWSPWVIDVRLQTEHDIVALPFTDTVSPHRTVAIDDLPIDGDILVYCKAGVRGKKACKRLIDLGVDSRRLFNLDGGIMKWRTDIDNKMPKY